MVVFVFAATESIDYSIVAILAVSDKLCTVGGMAAVKTPTDPPSTSTPTKNTIINFFFKILSPFNYSHETFLITFQRKFSEFLTSLYLPFIYS